MDSVKTDIAQDTILVGVGVSAGIGIGEAHLLSNSRLCITSRSIDADQAESEVAAFEKALEQTRHQLAQVKEDVQDKELKEHLYLLDTQLLILQDEMFVEGIKSAIRQDHVCAEGALKQVLHQFRDIFARIEDEYFRDRGSEVDYVGQRLLRNLLGVRQPSLKEMERQAIVVAHDLSPADTMQMDRRKIVGFVTDVGGRTSHTAILARSMGIPAVVGLEQITSMVPARLPLVIDGGSGTVVLNPSDATFREYLEKKQQHEYLEEELWDYRNVPACTRDGIQVRLLGNIDAAEDAQTTLDHGGEGVGLFRSEFLFLNRQQPPTEEEQLAIYQDAARRLYPHPITIRTLDVGGDKFVPEINLEDEANPAMGLRAIRFSLRERHLFRDQLRAILQAATVGNVRIMLPMITGVSEVRACRQLLQQYQQELFQEGRDYARDIDLGIMIETPAAAMIADFLAREVDFFSVGTNDLVQYCLAVDRGNEHVAYLYEPLHPALLRTLQRICDAARNAGIPVGICGEMAADPLYTVVLLALGFSEFSMHPQGLLRIKRMLCGIDSRLAAEVLAELLELSTAAEITRRMEQWSADNFPALFAPPKV